MFKRWILKAIVQKVISLLPFSFKINYFFQRFVTRRVHLSDEFLETMCEHHREAMHFWNIHGQNVRRSKVLELGTGWHPVIPVLYYLSGADEIVTIDLRPLIRKDNLHALLMKLAEWYRTGKLNDHLEYIDDSRMSSISLQLNNWPTREMPEILNNLKIRQWIGDAKKTDLTGEYFDICSSINVLEHVDAKIIPNIMKELKRLTLSNGMHYHAIGTYDHFVHIDSSISKFNYLKFSAFQWKLIDNSIQPQNRLRLSYFRDLFKQMNLEIKEEIFWENEQEEIARIAVHKDFENMDLLDIPYGTFVLRR